MTITLIEQRLASGADDAASGDATQTVLHVGGTVDLSTADTLTARLAGLVRNAGATVLVDLADVTFLDSTGLSALVASQLDATDQGSTMVLIRPTANVRSLLHLTGLDQVLKIRESLDPSV